MSELLLLSDGEPVLRCPLFGQAVSVGASPANDISLPGEGVPPLLCSFEPLGATGYRVVDRGGQGVVLRGNKAALHELSDGDEIPLGRLVARFVATQPRKAEGGAGQRTGVLKTRGDGQLCRVELSIELPDGGRVEIPDDGVRVGADPGNDIVIDDGFISSYHAHFFPKGARVFVRDLDSTNGTFIGDMRVVEAEVQPGAEVRVGQSTLRVVGEEKDEPVDAVDGDGPWSLGDLVTAEPAFAETFALIRKVAAHDASVCVLGETGTGKELVANALHAGSGRARGPMVALNCAAIPESLIEAELFGHEKGAFTGADKQRAGAFEQAHKGTLFLDEVGELPMDVQAKLLRALETRRVRRVGGANEIDVDVRIVAATHRDLPDRVAAGDFRQDLLHRLWVIPVKLPPLRDRPRDIVHLADHFAKALSPKGKVPKVTDGASRALGRHPYPGNVRELRNVIQRALILRAGEAIEEGDIQFLPVSLADQAAMAGVYRRGMTMEEVERAAFQGALACYRSASEAARALGIPKSTFWRRARALGVLNKPPEGEEDEA
jgi:DNA-binding NtrC family response regulator